MKELTEALREFTIRYKISGTNILAIPNYEFVNGELINPFLKWAGEYEQITPSKARFTYEEVGYEIFFTSADRWVLDEWVLTSTPDVVKDVKQRLGTRGYYLVQGRLLNSTKQIRVSSLQQVLQMAGL